MKELRNVHISAIVGVVILIGGAVFVHKSEAALQLVTLVALAVGFGLCLFLESRRFRRTGQR